MAAGLRLRRPGRTFFAGPTARPTAARELRAAGAARKGGTPGEGSPFDPLLRFFGDGEFRALRRASKGSAPGPRPLFCKKAGQKTFKRQSTSSPSPSPLGRVIQSVREADTLAAEWHLPREWERRVGPETSRGRHHPISVFLWGSTPFLWARPKKWGGTGSVNAKPTNSKTASSAQPKSTPGRGWMTAHITAVRMRLRAAGAARKGGTPGEGPPFDPLLRFVKHKRIPRAAARGQGLRPWTPPAFL